MVKYESLIEDFEMVVGDSSPIWYIGTPDGSRIDDGNWTARYFISDTFGGNVIIDKPLPINDGTSMGDVYPPGTRFVFQIWPEDSAILTQQKKYAVTVEISNLTLKYRREIARFWITMLPGG